MKITIDEIARVSGVSKGTVSRVINGKTTVAAATREKVLEVMNSLGFVPDPAARELSMRSKHTIGISIGQRDSRISPYFALIWRALARETQELGIQFIELHEDLPSYIRLPNAVLLFSAQHTHKRLDYLKSQNIPAVVIGHEPGHAFVVPDDHRGGQLAAEHLISLGHQQFAFLGTRIPSQAAEDRRNGFVDTLQKAGFSVQDEHDLEGHFNTLDAYRAIRKAWEAGHRFTALFAASDEMALGAIGALQDLDVQVPQQVSVVGFDGFPFPNTQLTTILQDISRIAHAAVQLALSGIEGEDPQGVYVPVQLQKGATTAAPPDVSH
ncbi:LacI family DNA-binding transcriptional regulator [Deinococcus roseus]|uniref:LacI family transcriptional regulator n=1 Tax=Deinococcus roseus TaxID=392414 RepID=A0ABQ2CZS7_9DEIO|nr:LacI family DNA-binding transcriptional regulator [Deinococcus roseus]GGJ36588.1 LacI family transcriptional regulator [Deinococcus roseus]